MNNVSCDGANCAAVGLDLTVWPYAMKPFFVYSNDEGKSWSRATTISGLTPAIAQLGSWMGFDHVNCKDKLCIAGGGRLDTIPNYYSNKPLLLLSRDGGKTWSFTPVAISTLAPLQVSEIDSLGCTGSHCVVIGGYESGSESSEFILSSKNAGLTWEVTKTIPGTSTDFLQRDTELEAMSCSDNLCVVAGKHDGKESNQSYPFFFTSKDGGMTWEFKKDIALLPEAKHFYLRGITGSQNNYLINHSKFFDRKKELRVCGMTHLS